MTLPLAPARPARRTLPPDCLAPTEAPWNGHVVGAYVRNSTPRQVDNARSRFQLTDMPAYLMGLGYGVRLYEEQGVSGATAVHKRKRMSQMLADLRDGEIDGVAAVDEKRLTRDEFGADTALIIKAVRDRGGLCITYGKTLDLRRKGDVRSFELMTKIGGWERIDIRDQMYQGMLKAAEEGPMFRGRTMVGHRRVPVIDEATGRPVLTREGRLKTTVEKDPAYAETMAELIRQFGVQPSLTEVAGDLNRRAVPSPWRTFKNPWTARRLRKLLRCPWYWGEVPLARAIGKPDVWINLDRDPTEVVQRKDDLAYWTKAQARAWLAALDGPSVRRSRYRGGRHLLVGVLSCANCHRPMHRGGTATNKGVEVPKYACPDVGLNHDCASPQWLNEEAAFRALRDALPAWLPEARVLAEEAARRLAERPVHPALAQIDALLETEEYLVERYERRATKANPVPERVQRQLDELDAEKRRLRALLEKDETDAVLSGRTAALAAQLRDEAGVLASFDRVTREEQAELYKLLLEWVEIRSTGGRGRNARPAVVDYRLRGEASTGPSSSRWVANLTRILPEVATA